MVPIFVNTYLPPLPKSRHCEALGKAILKVIEKRREKVAIISSGGMSHYPAPGNIRSRRVRNDRPATWRADHLPAHLAPWHAVVRFIPGRLRRPKEDAPAPKWDFTSKGSYQFYKHPDPHSYPLNKLINDLRHQQPLRIQLLPGP